MAAKSFKQMIKDGDLKRADAMKARLEDLHEEPGFNLRAEGEDLEQSIADLADRAARHSRRVAEAQSGDRHGVPDSPSRRPG